MYLPIKSLKKYYGINREYEGNGNNCSYKFYTSGINLIQFTQYEEGFELYLNGDKIGVDIELSKLTKVKKLPLNGMKIIDGNYEYLIDNNKIYNWYNTDKIIGTFKDRIITEYMDDICLNDDVIFHLDYHIRNYVLCGQYIILTNESKQYIIDIIAENPKFQLFDISNLHLYNLSILRYDDSYILYPKDNSDLISGIQFCARGTMERVMMRYNKDKLSLYSQQGLDYRKLIKKVFLILRKKLSRGVMYIIKNYIY